jgi:hypothetical protein
VKSPQKARLFSIWRGRFCLWFDQRDDRTRGSARAKASMPVFGRVPREDAKCLERGNEDSRRNKEFPVAVRVKSRLPRSCLETRLHRMMRDCQHSWLLEASCTVNWDVGDRVKAGLSQELEAR